MAIPSSPTARLFYRAATERFEDASVLLQLNRTTGSVYLAGYSIETMLKALILASVPRSQEAQVLSQFRGNQAHDYEWLIQLYRETARSGIPRFLLPHFSRVTIWSTNIRYAPDTVDTETANTFLKSTAVIVEWANGRLA